METTLKWLAGPGQYPDDDPVHDEVIRQFQHDKQYLVAVKLVEGDYDYAVINCYVGNSGGMYWEQGSNDYPWEFSDVEWFIPCDRIDLPTEPSP